MNIRDSINTDTIGTLDFMLIPGSLVKRVKEIYGPEESQIKRENLAMAYAMEGARGLAYVGLLAGAYAHFFQ